MEEHEEPTLPPLSRLPGVSWDEQSQSFSNNPRKRVRRGRAAPPSSAFNSSDPAIFSSDDDPALENYTPGRHKRRYVGTWESQEPASADSTFDDMSQTPRPKRTFARQKDSGVFLGSDCDDGDETLQDIETPKQSKSKVLQLNISPRPNISNEESIVRTRIQRSVDNGEEVIDLHDSGLKELSNDTISPLAQLARIPIVARDVAFEHRDPELKLYLSSNLLTRLPGALFDLNNLTVLSLRGNNLRELPPSISKLDNLKELNVAQNNLQTLPIELLDLFEGKRALEKFVLHPNPFVRPNEQEDPDGKNTMHFPQGSMEPDGPIPHFGSKNIGEKGIRSQPKYFNGRGSEVQPLNPESAPAVPSLVELVMRKCAASTSLEAMQSMMADFRPLEGLFRRAIDQKYEGGMVCSFCRRSIVVPAEQWVEWRYVARWCWYEELSVYVMEPISFAAEEMMIPFVYRACTSACGT